MSRSTIFHDFLRSHFTCPLCDKVADAPTLCTNCSRIFCSSCLGEALSSDRHCVECGGVLRKRDLKERKPLTHLIQDFQNLERTVLTLSEASLFLSERSRTSSESEIERSDPPMAPRAKVARTKLHQFVEQIVDSTPVNEPSQIRHEQRAEFISAPDSSAASIPLFDNNIDETTSPAKVKSRLDVMAKLQVDSDSDSDSDLDNAHWLISKYSSRPSASDDSGSASKMLSAPIISDENENEKPEERFTDSDQSDSEIPYASSSNVSEDSPISSEECASRVHSLPEVVTVGMHEDEADTTVHLIEQTSETLRDESDNPVIDEALDADDITDELYEDEVPKPDSSAEYESELEEQDASTKSESELEDASEASDLEQEVTVYGIEGPVCLSGFTIRDDVINFCLQQGLDLTDDIHTAESLLVPDLFRRQEAERSLKVLHALSQSKPIYSLWRFLEQPPDDLRDGLIVTVAGFKFGSLRSISDKHSSILDGLNIAFIGELRPPKAELEIMVHALGGQVVKPGTRKYQIDYAVFSDDDLTTRDSRTLTRLQKMNVPCVVCKWLLDSISCYSLLPTDDYNL